MQRFTGRQRAQTYVVTWSGHEARHSQCETKPWVMRLGHHAFHDRVNKYMPLVLLVSGTTMLRRWAGRPLKASSLVDAGPRSRCDELCYCEQMPTTFRDSLFSSRRNIETALLTCAVYVPSRVPRSNELCGLVFSPPSWQLETVPKLAFSTAHGGGRPCRCTSPMACGIHVGASDHARHPSSATGAPRADSRQAAHFGIIVQGENHFNEIEPELEIRPLLPKCQRGKALYDS